MIGEGPDRRIAITGRATGTGHQRERGAVVEEERQRGLEAIVVLIVRKIAIDRGIGIGAPRIFEQVTGIVVTVAAPVRLVAGRLGVRVLPVELEIVERRKQVFSGQLLSGQLVLDPFELVVARIDAVDDAVAGARAIVCLAQLHHGQAEPMVLADIESDPDKGARVDCALGAVDGERTDRSQPGVATVVDVADLVAGIPLLAVADRTDDAETDIVVELIAIAEAQRKARIGAGLFLLDAESRAGKIATIGLQLGRRCPVRIVDRLRPQVAAVGDRPGQRARKFAGAVIVTGPVPTTAVVAQTILEGGAVVVSERALHAEERRPRHFTRAQLHGTAAELTRHVRRIGFLHDDAVEQFVREQVERHDAAREVRARNLGAVEQHARIALAESAHIDVATIDQAQSRHALERRGCVGVAGARYLFRTERLGYHRGEPLFIEVQGFVAALGPALHLDALQVHRIGGIGPRRLRAIGDLDRGLCLGMGQMEEDGGGEQATRRSVLSDLLHFGFHSVTRPERCHGQSGKP